MHRPAAAIRPSRIFHLGLSLAVAGALLSPFGLAAHEHGEIKVTPNMAKDLSDIPGKEGLVVTVELPPGYASEPHRHEAHTFVYMLEGSVEMQVEGGKPVTLQPGEMFYENPQDIHTVARNLSSTKPARFLVFFVKNKNAPPVLPATKN